MFKAFDEFLYIILLAFIGMSVYQLGYLIIDYKCEMFVCEM